MTKQRLKQRLRRLESHRRRQLLIESLESRELLAAHTVQTKTGDVAQVIVGEIAAPISPNAQFQLSGQAFIEGAVRTPLYFQQNSPSTQQDALTGDLQVYATTPTGQAVVGHVIRDPGFASSGVFWFAPSVDSNLPQDSDLVSPGWQGQIQFQVQVGTNPVDIKFND